MGESDVVEALEESRADEVRGAFYFVCLGHIVVMNNDFDVTKSPNTVTKVGHIRLHAS